MPEWKKHEIYLNDPAWDRELKSILIQNEEKKAEKKEVIEDQKKRSNKLRLLSYKISAKRKKIDELNGKIEHHKAQLIFSDGIEHKGHKQLIEFFLSERANLEKQIEKINAQKAVL